MIVDGLLMSAGGLGGARLARPLSLRLASDALYVPTIHLDEQFRYRARTPFDKDTSEARIYTDLKDSIVRVSGFSQHGGGTYVNHESGFFVDPSGQIMTALHSVKGAHTIEVRTAPGDTFAARLEHFDAANDLALLKITDRSADGSFKSLSLASSASRLTEGSPVFGLGVPAPTIGANTLFLSPGKFLQRESLLQSNEVATNSIARQAAGENLEREVLQGEMHIEGGMSGGPLVDSQGHVLGLITGSRRYKGELPSVAKATPVDALRALYHLAVGTL
jgi:S1-C subfamily serine protease